VSTKSARESILDAADKIVAREGALHMTLDAVAAQAGVSKGGLIYHFPSQHDLLLAMITRFTEQVDARRSRLRASLPGTGARDVLAHILNWSDASAKDRRTAGALLAAITRAPELIRPVRKAYTAALEVVQNAPGHPDRLAILAMAADGIWLMELLGLQPFSAEKLSRIKSELVKLAHEWCGGGAAVAPDEAVCGKSDARELKRKHTMTTKRVAPNTMPSARTRRAHVLAGGLILALAMAGCGKAKGPMGPPPGGPPQVAVMVVQPERAAISTELAGRISASLVAEVRPQVTGIIQQRLFEEGAAVKAGDVLYQIDPALHEAAHAAARAALARTTAQISALRAQTKRYQELVAIKAVSQQEFDDADAALRQAEAELESDKAAVEMARINLAYTRITAPISGRIGKSEVTIGALVTANQASPLAVIQQLDPVYVDVTQSSVNLLRLKRNLAAGRLKEGEAGVAKVGLVLEDGTAYPLAGLFKFSDVTVDPSTGSVILRTVFANPDGMLLPGMYVRALIEEGVNEQAVLIPQRGVTRDPKGRATALVLDASDKVEQRVLQIERAMGDRWLVNEGLKAGDRVILEGLQRVAVGSPVIAVPFGVTNAAVPKAESPASGKP
jgi:membrane fusion protein (multidrug efflux system)